MTRPRVFVTRTLPDAPPLARLRARADVDLWETDGPPPDAVLAARARDADGLLVMITERVDGALLDACPRVRVVASMGAGVDHVDVAAATARGVAVVNTPGVVTEATADLAFALMLAAARRLAEGERAVREGRWGPWSPTWLLGRPVHGATLGIVGPGRIGAAVARRAGAFGMHVLYHGRRAIDGFPGERVAFADLLARSDFVSVHVPLTPSTAGMFGQEEFRAMPAHAIFVNTARGGVVDQAALRDALRAGEIAGAAIDVTTPEPLPPGDPLLDAPNLLVLPHLGSATGETRAQMASLAVDGMIDVLEDRMPPHLVNVDAWPHRRGAGEGGPA